MPKRTTYADYDVTHAREVVVDENFVCSIPDGAQALYMGNKLVQYRLGSHIRMGSDDITYHFVLWNGVHAWISSEEASIEKVT